jgi:hypothetical protein
MPRELLLPIPHAIADKVHHLLTDEAEFHLDPSRCDNPNPTLGRDFEQLAEKLETLAREAGVIGW